MRQANYRLRRWRIIRMALSTSQPIPNFANQHCAKSMKFAQYDALDVCKLRIASDRISVRVSASSPTASSTGKAWHLIGAIGLTPINEATPAINKISCGRRHRFDPHQ